VVWLINICWDSLSHFYQSHLYLGFCHMQYSVRYMSHGQPFQKLLIVQNPQISFPARGWVTIWDKRPLRKATDWKIHRLESGPHKTENRKRWCRSGKDLDARITPWSWLVIYVWALSFLIF
jgi:hypothetical protein